MPLFVAYYRRGQPKFRKVKELVESGALGEVRSFNYQYASPVPQEDPERTWLYDKSVAGGGKLYDVGSHMIDIMLFFFGDVRSAAGVSSNQSGAYEINDNTSGILCFRSGVQGTLQMTFNGLRRQDEMTIVGSEGTLVFSIMSNDPLLLYRGGGEMETYAFEPLEHVQLPLITRVVRTLQGQDDLPADGTYGLRTQEILEALENSETLTYE